MQQIDEQIENSEQQAHPPRLQVQRQQEHSGNGSASNSGSSTSVENQKTRSTREIYEQNNDIEQPTHFALLSCQPTFFEEAIKEEQWVEAMNEEIEAIERNKTWDLVDLPVDKSNIGVKWVYKTKLNEK